MTLPDLFETMIRRWYIPAASLAIAMTLTALFYQAGGVYSTRTIVAFTLPNAPLLAPENGLTDENHIAFAGAIAEEITEGHPSLRYAATDAPYYGAGIRQGMWVGLPESGGQWVRSYPRAEIELHIVGPTYAWVEARQYETLRAIERLTLARQASVTWTNPATHVQAQVDRSTTRIQQVRPTLTSQLAAALAMGGAALLTGAGLAGVLDRSTVRRRTRIQPRRIGQIKNERRATQ